ncbi:uncharacterized protein HD556DRAFT_1310310 [Suillus plorans]|uniref:Uncharacterized protein n=1 Tax=Suillus plorans TaxID=116603 RepID=A0A9P7AJG7_9AGAM|nr:uncharacterized protein HD556DRAFT_1310310 [Suillus plorans]KAG1790760.1 hypothetical protein HD556DRAFT_1310310 [Suillus plorans]
MTLHLASYDLTLALPPEEHRSECDFYFEAYQFLQAGYQKNGSQKMSACDLPGRLITLEYLRKCAKFIPNPSSSENFPVLWCSPTIANITGSLLLPLSLQAGRHTCLASRVFDTFKTAVLVEDSDNLMCFDFCPNISDKAASHGGLPGLGDTSSFQMLPHFLPSTLQLSSGSSSTLLLTSTSLLSSSVSSLASMSSLPSLLSPLLLSPQPHQSIPVRDSTLLTALLEDAETVFAEWQQNIINCLWSPVLPDGRDISPLVPSKPDSSDITNVLMLMLEGPDLQTTAMGFASFVHSKLEGLPVYLPKHVTIPLNFDICNIFHPERTWSIGYAVGGGIECSVLQTSMKEVCHDQKLLKGGADGDTGYYNLNLCTNSIIPAQLISFQVLGFFAATHLFITGHSPVPLSPAILLFVIGSWEALFDLKLIDLSAEEWENITKQMFASILLGCPVIDDVADLRNFKKGFNMHVGAGTNAYGRTVTCPEDIIAHLAFISADDSCINKGASSSQILQAVSFDKEIKTLFIQKLQCYLTGTGHPEHPTLGPNIIALDCSDLMPHGDWTIIIRFKHDLPD